ncbi:MAG: hypothetical protein HY587_07275 [Candidatus Omnitrophica bacterium]|nr:hypothetical protein [Candidatus Omnitrophota bacterium]
MKSISKIYNWTEERREGCVTRTVLARRTGVLSRLKNCRGFNIAEVMVSASVLSTFMALSCGSLVQYQTAFGRVERTMTYTQQLQTGLDLMAQDISESNLNTFTDERGVALEFPIDLSSGPAYFKVANGTNAHGANRYSNYRIGLSVNPDKQLVREIVFDLGPLARVTSTKILATHVERVILSRVAEDSSTFISNALSAHIASTSILSTKEQAMRDSASQSSSQGQTCGEGEEAKIVQIGGREVRLCVRVGNLGTNGTNEGQGVVEGTSTNTNSNEKTNVTLERVVRLNN